MHQLLVMSARTHLRLRIGALVLLAAVAIWPRAKTGLNAAELARTGGSPPRSTHTTHGVAARTETTAARLVSRGPASAPAKVVVADADESRLTN